MIGIALRYALAGVLFMSLPAAAFTFDPRDPDLSLPASIERGKAFAKNGNPVQIAQALIQAPCFHRHMLIA